MADEAHDSRLSTINNSASSLHSLEMVSRQFKKPIGDVYDSYCHYLLLKMQIITLLATGITVLIIQFILFLLSY